MVVLLLSLLVGVTFPSVSAGIESLRLSSAADSIVSFLNAALNRAERRQEVMEVVISKAENALVLHSSEPGFLRRLEMPEGVSIAAVSPDVAPGQESEYHIILYPGSTPPRLGVEIVNRKGERRMVRVDPATGVPVVEKEAGR